MKTVYRCDYCGKDFQNEKTCANHESTCKLHKDFKDSVKGLLAKGYSEGYLIHLIQSLNPDFELKIKNQLNAIKKSPSISIVPQDSIESVLNKILGDE